MAIRLLSYADPQGNVGDDFSPWLFSRALGSRLSDEGDVLLFGVGSVLSPLFMPDRLPSAATFAVMGSGARSADTLPDRSTGTWHIYAVRGPLTAAALGMPCDTGVADPAILSSLLLPATPDARGPVGLVPYFRSSHRGWSHVTEKLGWRLVSPRQPVESFVEDLAGCSRVWCESMHGAIFADAYGIPWRPISGTSVRSEGRTHAFKWTDWCSAMGVGFDPLGVGGLPDNVTKPRARFGEWRRALAIAAILREADRQDRHLLSAREVLTARQRVLLARIDRMCRELTGAPSDIGL